VVGEAANAAQALVWLKAQSCDLLLLDIHMPGRDGMQLAAELQRMGGAPAVVFVTVHAEQCALFFVAFVVVGRSRVSPRRASNFLLLRQKESHQRKGDPEAQPPLRGGSLRCSAFAASRRTRCAPLRGAALRQPREVR
jgi:chemotaxis response regulator CheB